MHDKATSDSILLSCCLARWKRILLALASQIGDQHPWQAGNYTVNVSILDGRRYHHIKDSNSLLWCKSETMSIEAHIVKDEQIAPRWDSTKTVQCFHAVWPAPGTTTITYICMSNMYSMSRQLLQSSIGRRITRGQLRSKTSRFQQNHTRQL